METITAKRTYEPLISKNEDGDDGVLPLSCIHRTQNGELWAGGFNQLLRSQDRGCNWENLAGKLKIRDAAISSINSIEESIFVFVAYEQKICVLRSENGGESWVETSSIPCCWKLLHPFIHTYSRNSVLYVAFSGEQVRLLSSNDASATWQSFEGLPSGGTLIDLSFDGSGNGIIAFLYDVEGVSGVQLRSVVSGLSADKMRVNSSTLISSNIQSIVYSGKGEWLLGGDGGMIYKYSLLTPHLEVEKELSNDDLNISGLDEYNGVILAMAETSDPPPSVSLFLRNREMEWIAFQSERQLTPTL
jgi:photosystem II stability/assembly factor-like uncharacterized protein